MLYVDDDNNIVYAASKRLLGMWERKPIDMYYLVV